MIHENTIERPKTLREVAEKSDSLQDFGTNLRDWQHEIQRGGVHSYRALTQRLEKEPPRLSSRFEGGDVADAYLAAYAEWIADQAGILRPKWCGKPDRCANDPWFSTPVRGQLLATTPASFRQRNIFTIPDSVFSAKPGRPRVSEARKREKARLRQKAYRTRVRTLLLKARLQTQLAG